jgi:hypothetical protein
VIGVAVDAGGNALPECVVSVTEPGKRMREAVTAETDAEGKFTLELAEGSWNLTLATKDTKLKGARTVEVSSGETFDAGKIKLLGRKVGAR